MYSLHSLILCGITGFCIGLGITLAIFRLSRKNGLGKVHDPKSPIQKLIRVLLFCATKENADAIIFGEPMEPFEKGEKPEPKSDKMDDIGQFLQSLEKCFPADAAVTVPYFSSSAVQEIPVWHKIYGKYYQLSSFPINLLFPVIEELLIYEQNGINLKNGGEGSSLIKYSVSMMENYCYEIKLASQEATHSEANQEHRALPRRIV